MNFKKIVIYQHKVLFNILDEIKEKLNFDLSQVDKDDIDILKKKLDDDYLLISSSEVKTIKNQLLLDKIPIKIEKLLELINIKILKQNFNSQSDVKEGLYKLNLNSREITKKDISIDLTEREINLILFLKRSKKATKIDTIQKEVWDYNPELETHTVETHIYRLRKKIKEKFYDENFILSSKEGYFIK